MSADNIPDNVIDKKLYLQVKKDSDKIYKKPSAYRSMWIQKEYMKRGGEYTHKTKGLSRWRDEEWVQVIPYLEKGKKVECGEDNRKNKACRPLKRVNDETPMTIPALVKKFGKDKILALARKKIRDMSERVDWEQGGKSNLEVHSILFDKDYFTESEAERWLRDHKYKTSYYGKGVDETKDYYRYRQKSPKKFKDFRTKKITDGILFVFGIK